MVTSFKKLLFTSLLILPVSLASCGKEEKKEECIHHWSDYTYLDETYHHHICDICKEDVKGEHVYSNPTTLIEPTCSTEGKQIKSCSICGYEKEEVISPTGEHKYNQNIVLENNANLKLKADCSHPAIYYKTCACGAFIKSDEVPTFESGKALEHTITSFSVSGDLEKVKYAAFEQFDPNGLTFSAYCSTCGSDIVVPYSDITFVYLNGENSFRFGETKVTAKYNNKEIDINNISVDKVTNEIYGIEDQDICCGDKVILAPYAKYDSKADIKTVVIDKNNNNIDFNKENAFNADGSPYTVTATLNGNKNYGDAKLEKTITVSHSDLEWFNDGFYDNLVCSNCNKVERTFRTQVDVNFDTNIENTTVNFDNLSSDSDVSYTIYDLDGKEVSEPISFARSDYFTDLNSPVLDKPEFQKAFIAIEDDTGYEHQITLSVNLATKVLSKYEDLNEVAASDSKLDIRGIYVLNNDINCIASLTTPYKQSVSTGNLNNCFHGTFDGRYYAIDNLKNTGYGLFCGIGNGSAEGTVKNIRFTNVHLTIIACNHYSRVSLNDEFAPLLARTVYNGNISNIHVEVSDIDSNWEYDPTRAMMNSILFSHGEGGWLTFKNNYIDTLNIKKKLQFAICAYWTNTNASAPDICANNIIKINDYDKIASNQTGIPNGFTIIKG